MPASELRKLEEVNFKRDYVFFHNRSKPESQVKIQFDQSAGPSSFASPLQIVA